jgi:hypothetical protein
MFTWNECSFVGNSETFYQIQWFYVWTQIDELGFVDERELCCRLGFKKWLLICSKKLYGLIWGGLFHNLSYT